MKKDDYFMVEYKGNDRSWRSSTFRCIASDDRVVVGLICGKKSNIFTDPLSFNRAEWEFYPATMDVVDAQCFDPIARIKELEGKVAESEYAQLIAEHQMRSLQYRHMRLTATTDLSIISMFVAIAIAAICIGLLVFKW